MLQDGLLDPVGLARLLTLIEQARFIQSRSKSQTTLCTLPRSFERVEWEN